MAIDTVLFDFGGVIFTALDKKVLLAGRAELAQSLGFATAGEMWGRFFKGREWELTKTGHWSDVEMWAALLEPLGLNSGEMQSDFVAQLYQGVGLKPEMRNLIIELHSRWRLGILSNASDVLDSLLNDRLAIGDYFDVVVNSHYIGVAKPDRRAYEIALKRLEASPERVFFIDDQERNTRAAEVLEIRSHVFIGVADLRAELVELSLLEA